MLQHLQHASTTAPTCTNVLVEMNKIYNKNMLEHIGACDANKPYVCLSFYKIIIEKLNIMNKPIG